MKRSDTRLLDNPWFILVLLFGAMGVLGVPLLVKSRAFSPLVKCVIAVTVTLYTALLVWLVWLVLVWSYGRISETLGW